MPDNVYELLVAENPKLAAQLNTNEDVSDFLMTAYSHLLQIAVDSPNDPKNLMCLVDIVKERLLRIRTEYYGGDTNGGVVGDKNPSQRNLNLVKFLRVNRNVKSLAERVVSLLERWVNEHPATKQQGFSKIKIVNAVHHADHTFTAELVVKFQFDEYVHAKMNWEMDEAETEPQSEGGVVTL